MSQLSVPTQTLAMLTRIARTLDSIEQILRPEGTAVTLEIMFTNTNGPDNPKGEDKMRIGQTVTAVIKGFKDKDGKPAKVDGVPVWDNSNTAAIEMIVAEDGMSATFKGLDLGDAVITAKADADMSEGQKFIIATGGLSVVSGEAVEMDLEFGEPVDPAPAA